MAYREDKGERDSQSVQENNKALVLKAFGRWQSPEGRQGRTGTQACAHECIDDSTQDAVAVLNALGWVDAVLTTSSDAESIGPVLAALTPHGHLVALGIPFDPIKVDLSQLVVGSRSITSYFEGAAIEEEDTIRFSALQGVAPMVERVTLEKPEDAFAKTMAGQARFRMVLHASMK